MITPTIENAKELLSVIPQSCSGDYGIYINVISALANSFDETTATLLVAWWAPDRTLDTARREYSYKVKHAKPGVGFGMLIYIAKQFGFSSTKLDVTNRFSRDFSPRLDKNIERKKPVTFDDVMIKNKFDKFGNRQYNVMINDKIANKNLNVQHKTHLPNYWLFNNRFTKFELTAEELAFRIGAGNAFCCANLKKDFKGNVVRKTESWDGAELFAIDVDSGLTIRECLKIPETRKALLLYTTSSHTKINQRFRIVFPLPYYEEEISRYKEVIGKFVKIYGADPVASSAVTGFYGNDNAHIILIKSGELLKFKGGILISRKKIGDNDSTNKPAINTAERTEINVKYKEFEIKLLNNKTIRCWDKTAENLKNFYKSQKMLFKYIRDIATDEYLYVNQSGRIA